MGVIVSGAYERCEAARRNVKLPLSQVTVAVAQKALSEWLQLAPTLLRRLAEV